MDGDSVVSVNDVGADRRQDAVGGIGSGDRTFAWRTCLADIVPDTPAAVAGIDPRARNGRGFARRGLWRVKDFSSHVGTRFVYKSVTGFCQISRLHDALLARASG